MTCRGGLTWWRKYLIVGCYNFQDETDEVSGVFSRDDKTTKSLKKKRPISYHWSISTPPENTKGFLFSGGKEREIRGMKWVKQKLLSLIPDAY